MSLLVSIGVDSSDFQKGITKAENQTKAVSKSLGASSAEITRSNQMLVASVVGMAVAGAAGLKSLLNEHIAYANSVRDLASVGSTSAESASRFIQVLDDYKLTANDAMLASKALKEQGLVPNIETLAKLSDAYLKIKDPVERLKFVQDNLGRSGLKYVQILEKGSAALLKQNAEVDKSLILTQRMVDDARRAEIALDNWGDAVNGLKTAFAVGLLPILTKVGNHFNDVITSFKEQGYWYTLLHQFNLKDVADRREQATALMTAKGATDELATSLENIVDPAKAAQEALQAMSSENQNYISGLMSFASSESSYRDNQRNQIDQIAQAQQNLTNAVHEYGSGSKEALDASAELEDAKAGLQDLEKQWKDTTTRMVFDMMQTRFMADGILSEVETKALTSFAKREGLFSEAQAAEFQRLTSIAEFQVRAIEGSEAWLSEMDRQKQSLGEITGMIEGVGAAMAGVQQYSLPIGPMMGGGNLPSKSLLSGASGGSFRPLGGGRAMGGSVFAGTPYTVGEHGVETFVPNTNGTILPNNSNANNSGQNITINITNPKREAAEDSVRKALKNLSYLGVADA